MTSRSTYALWLVGLAVAVPTANARDTPGIQREPAVAFADGTAATAGRRNPHCADANTRDRRLPAKVGEWALVWGDWEAGGWTDVLIEPKQNAPRVAQALLGDRVEILRQRGGWMETKELGQAWQGWIQAAHLTYGSDRVRRAFRTMPIIALASSAYSTIDGCGNLAPFGPQLPLVEDSGTHLQVQLPDGRKFDVRRSEVAPTWQPKSLEVTLMRVNALLRRPFQIGGNSPAAVDGAGLVFLILRASGYLHVPRAPAALWEMSTLVGSGEMKPGDILLLDSPGGQPSPAILVTDSVLLESSPASGVNFLPLDQLSRHRLLEVRRFSEPFKLMESVAPLVPSSALPAVSADDVEVLAFLIIIMSQQIVLLAVHWRPSYSAGSVVTEVDRVRTACSPATRIFLFRIFSVAPKNSR